jgi:hypothetical protein
MAMSMGTVSDNERGLSSVIIAKTALAAARETDPKTVAVIG